MLQRQAQNPGAPSASPQTGTGRRSYRRTFRPLAAEMSGQIPGAHGAPPLAPGTLRPNRTVVIVVGSWPRQTVLPLTGAARRPGHRDSYGTGQGLDGCDAP